MHTQLGGIYRLQLQLFNTEQLVSSSWLVGALGVNYRQADIIAIDYYSSGEATVRILWKNGIPGDIPEGDRIVPFLGEIDVSGQTTPYAVVKSIEELEVLPVSGKVDYKLKIAGAVALIAVTAYLSMRIKYNVERAPRV